MTAEADGVILDILKRLEAETVELKSVLADQARQIAGLRKAVDELNDRQRREELRSLANTLL